MSSKKDTKEKCGGHGGHSHSHQHKPAEMGSDESDHDVKAASDPLSKVNLTDKSSASELIEHLPKPVKRRINALKKLLLGALNIEAEFYIEVHKLECEYAEKTKSLNIQRTKIVNGEHEPTDEEADFPLAENLANELKEKANINGPVEEEADKPEDSLIKGIPEFWLTVFKNVDILAEMVQESDEPLIRHLLDIEVQMSCEPMGFTLVFHFSPNEFFTNATLTKEYSLQCHPDKDEPFDFEGPEIVSCKGCKIDWKTGKNVTVKLIKKKQKHKTKGQTRFVTKEVKADSFFNFFDPPEVPPNTDDADDETRELLNADFEIGQILRDRIVPRAVLYFTGEANDDESYDGDEDEDGDDFDDEEDEDEGDDPQV
jgi:nucleosome assembly protein 1-like 1